MMKKITVYAFEAFDEIVSKTYLQSPLKATIERIGKFRDHRIIVGTEEEVDPKKVDSDGWYHPTYEGPGVGTATMRTLILGAIFLTSFSVDAFADWWIVRSSDKQCLVVDIEPTGKGITKIGKPSYKTQKEAEADAKQLCKEPAQARKKSSGN